MTISTSKQTGSEEDKKQETTPQKQNSHKSGTTHRNVTHIAASKLQEHGYMVIKSVTRSWPYDLVACNQHDILFITARRHTKVQTPKQILHMYTDLIAAMWQIPTPAIAEKQIWIYHNNQGFAIYKLFQNGIMKKEFI